MKKTLIAFTPGLRKVLDHLAASQETHVGPRVEELLRNTPIVKKAKEELRLEWSKRPQRSLHRQFATRETPDNYGT